MVNIFKFWLHSIILFVQFDYRKEVNAKYLMKCGVEKANACHEIKKLKQTIEDEIFYGDDMFERLGVDVEREFNVANHEISRMQRRMAKWIEHTNGKLAKIQKLTDECGVYV